MSATSTSFEEKLAIDNNQKTRRTLREKNRALAKLAKDASTFSHWLEIYYRTSPHSVLEEQVLHILATLPVPATELLEVLEFAPCESKLRALIEKRLARQGLIELKNYKEPFSFRINRYVSN